MTWMRWHCATQTRMQMQIAKPRQMMLTQSGIQRLMQQNCGNVRSAFECGVMRGRTYELWAAAKAAKAGRTTMEKRMLIAVWSCVGCKIWIPKMVKRLQ